MTFHNYDTQTFTALPLAFHNYDTRTLIALPSAFHNYDTQTLINLPLACQNSGTQVSYPAVGFLHFVPRPFTALPLNFRNFDPESKAIMRMHGLLSRPLSAYNYAAFLYAVITKCLNCCFIDFLSAGNDRNSRRTRDIFRCKNPAKTLFGR